jgi:hypothetical protein
MHLGYGKYLYFNLSGWIQQRDRSEIAASQSIHHLDRSFTLVEYPDKSLIL